MDTVQWDLHFLTSTRGKIICLMRFSSRTVNELAEMLDLTDNAIRSHISVLEKEGLIYKKAMRRGHRRPHAEYDLTSEAMNLFPKAYEPVLKQILDVFKQHYPPHEVENMAREVGHRLSSDQLNVVEGCDVEARMNKALDLFREMGGLAGVEEREDRTFLLGYSCPLPSLSVEHREACRIMETFLTDLIGLPVQEQCDRSTPPRCFFEIIRDRSP